MSKLESKLEEPKVRKGTQRRESLCEKVWLRQRLVVVFGWWVQRKKSMGYVFQKGAAKFY